MSLACFDLSSISCAVCSKQNHQADYQNDNDLNSGKCCYNSVLTI